MERFNQVFHKFCAFFLLTPNKMGSRVCLKCVNHFLKLEFKSLRLIQNIWTVGIIPICLVLKIVGEVNEKRGKVIFVPKVYKIKNETTIPLKMFPIKIQNFFM